MGKSHLLMLMCCTLALGAACGNPGREQSHGLPPASDWEAPVLGGTQGPATVNPTNPHAGAGMSNPHAGMGMNDPHAGMNMADPHAGMNMGDPQGGIDVTALGLQPPDPNRPIDPNKSLSGTIKPTADTKAKVPPGSVIFLSVKRADASGQPTGAPLAVKRLMVGTWPLWFRVTEEDAMVGGTELAGEVVVTAWSDQDQDAISKLPGDVLGQVRATIPSKDLVLVLDQVIK